MAFIEPCFGIGHSLSLICQMTSEDIKHQLIIIKALVFLMRLIHYLRRLYINKLKKVNLRYLFVLDT